MQKARVWTTRQLGCFSPILMESPPSLDAVKPALIELNHPCAFQGLDCALCQSKGVFFPRLK